MVGLRFDVGGPVQAEVFVLCLIDGRPVLTGPCGPAPWYLEVCAEQDPMAVVSDAIRRVIYSNRGEPALVHSTSWRRDRDAVILSFVTVVDRATVSHMPTKAVDRATLARGGAATAPTGIATDQVIEHGLRHLAWLAHDDPTVASRLTADWHITLAGYQPEPFRHL